MWCFRRAPSDILASSILPRRYSVADCSYPVHYTFSTSAPRLLYLKFIESATMLDSNHYDLQGPDTDDHS